MTGEQNPKFPDTLELVTKIAAAGAILLPFVGLVVRMVRFWRVPDGLGLLPGSLGAQIASAQDVPNLVLSGLHADFVAAQWIVVWAVLGVLGDQVRKWIEGLPLKEANRDRLLRALPWFAALLVLIFYALFVYPIVGAVAVALLTLVGWLLIRQEVTGAARHRGGLVLPGIPDVPARTPLRWYSVTAAAMVIGVSAAVATGSDPWQPQGERLAFATDQKELSAGWYGELGRTSDQVLLTPCDGSGIISVVDPSSIATVTFASTPPRSRNASLLLGGSPEVLVGFQPGCSYP